MKVFQPSLQLYWACCAVVVVVILPTTCNVFVSAWGTLGHEIVANIAWHRISNETQQWIVNILGPLNHTEEDGSPLGAVADWADRVRHFKPWSSPLHYIDVRDDLYKGGCHYHSSSSSSRTTSSSSSNNTLESSSHCSFDYDRDCPNDICVAGAIVNYTSQLYDNDQTKKASAASKFSSLSSHHVRSRSVHDSWIRQQALRFITHFIGDIHQPLHCSRTTDKGGNDFHVHFDFNLTTVPLSRRDLRQQQSSLSSLSSLQRYNSHHHHHHPSWNLHSVWDTGIIEVTLMRDYNNSRVQMEMELLDKSLNKDVEEPYLKCSMGRNVTCTQLWGQESFAMALQYAYEMESGIEVQSGSTLTEEYYKTRLPIVKDRLMAAGIRLAATLETIYNETTGKQQQDSKDHHDAEHKAPLSILTNLRMGFAM